jgi:peroxin-10
LFFYSEIIPYICERISNRLNVWTRPSYAGIPVSQTDLRTRLNNLIQRLIPFFKDTKSYFSKLHLGIFYLGGYFYEFSKRLAGIKYIFDRPVVMYKTQYHILGLLIFVQLIVSTYSYIKSVLFLQRNHDSINEWIEETYVEHAPDDSAPPDCVLCLEPRNYPTVAECGHIFCWNCIHDSCQSKPECPLCRQPISPQTLTRIYHYSV